MPHGLDCRPIRVHWAMAPTPDRVRPDAPRAPAARPAGGSFWFSTAGPGPARADRPEGTRRSTSRSSAAGSPACGRRSACSRPSPSLRVVVLEAERVGSGASGRNGGFCAASLTHGLGNGLLHFPDEIDVLEARGRAQPRRARHVRARRADRLRPRADGRPRRRHRAVAGRRAPGVGRARGAPRHRARVPRSRRGPGRGPLAALARRRARGRRPHRDGQPREARVGGSPPRPSGAARRSHEASSVTAAPAPGGAACA